MQAHTGVDSGATLSCMQEKTFVTESTLIEDAFKLGVQVFNSGFRPTFVVGLWRGGSSVGIYVQECLQHLGVETNHIALRTSYRGIDAYHSMVENPADNIRVHGTQYLLEALHAEDRLLIVDDVCGSGWTLQVVHERLRHKLKRNMATDTRSAVIWHKPAQNRSGRIPDYFLHQTDEWLVLPYELTGLSAEEIRRHKPGAAALLAASGHLDDG
ncbi:MAG: phosphoribosyltransferase family protein [Pseudomonadota bacterium]